MFYNFKVHDDVGSSEREGVSVFYKDPTGSVFHTYSTYGRGIDMVNTAYHYLDFVPKGRVDVAPIQNQKSVHSWGRGLSSQESLSRKRSA